MSREAPPRRTREELNALLVGQGYDLDSFARFGGGPDAPVAAYYEINGIWHARDEDTGDIIATGPSLKSVMPHADIVEVPEGSEGVDAALASYLRSLTPPNES